MVGASQNGAGSYDMLMIKYGELFHIATALLPGWGSVRPWVLGSAALPGRRVRAFSSNSSSDTSFGGLV